MTGYVKYTGQPLRKGDKVLIKAVVISGTPDREGEICVSDLRAVRAFDESYVLPSAIHSIAPRGFKVGDRVRVCDSIGGGIAEVAAPPRESGGRLEVAIWSAEGGYCCAPVMYLTHAPEQSDEA